MARRRNSQDTVPDFESYATGPGRKREVALLVSLKRGYVEASEWRVDDNEPHDRRGDGRVLRLSFGMLLSSLLSTSANFRQSYSGDAGYSLAEVQDMPKAAREKAIVAAAISRLVYGPNDEKYVRKLGD